MSPTRGQGPTTTASARLLTNDVLAFSRRCSELCCDANCAYICNPPCDAGTVCLPYTTNNMCVYPMRWDGSHCSPA
jgi:hypothetical protein